MDKKFLFYDMESCNGSMTGASMCSFGYCLTTEIFEVLEKDDFIINPKARNFKLGRSGEEAKIKLCFPENVFRSAPTFDAWYPQIKALIARADYVFGYSMHNDVTYVNNACDEYGLERIQYDYYDIQLLYSKLNSLANGVGLAKVALSYGFEFLEHKSEDDAEATMIVAKNLCKSKGLPLLTLFENAGLEMGYVRDKVKRCYDANKTSTQGAIVIEERGKNKKIMTYFKSMIFATPPKVVGKAYRGKSVMFSEYIELTDILRARHLIEAIYAQGGRYTNRLDFCNVFVYCDKSYDCGLFKQISRLISDGKKVELLSEQQFIASLGALPTTEYDDYDILFEIKKQKYIKEQQKELNKSSDIPLSAVEE